MLKRFVCKTARDTFLALASTTLGLCFFHAGRSGIRYITADKTKAILEESALGKKPNLKP